MAKHCFRAVVNGRVQGVFFRGSTQKQAKNLDITGWIKNLPSGDVELIACGEEAQLQKFRQWLAKGPPAAKVISLQCDDTPWQEFNDFEIIR